MAEYQASIYEQKWIDFGNPLSDKAKQFMMENLGFPDINHLTIEECKELSCDLHQIEAHESTNVRVEGIDINDPKYYDEDGELMGKPLSEYALMISGMIVYLGKRIYPETSIDDEVGLASPETKAKAKKTRELFKELEEKQKKKK
jgi:hypothetical protein